MDLKISTHSSEYLLQGYSNVRHTCIFCAGLCQVFLYPDVWFSFFPIQTLCILSIPLLNKYNLYEVCNYSVYFSRQQPCFHAKCCRYTGNLFFFNDGPYMSKMSLELIKSAIWRNIPSITVLAAATCACVRKLSAMKRTGGII